MDYERDVVQNISNQISNTEIKTQTVQQQSQPQNNSIMNYIGLEIQRQGGN